MNFPSSTCPRAAQAVEPAGSPASQAQRHTGGPPRREGGVALVITLILLSVVTFLAVAFLFLSRRERGAVTTSVDQTTSRLAAEAAVEHAKATVLAPIIATTNGFSYDLTVSRNFINPLGFVRLSASPTNVNYDYLASEADLEQNIANLFYNPRPPVFIADRRSGLTDFRYYVDLNRNGRFDTNGMIPVIDSNGQPVTMTTTNGPLVVSNFFVGDPEWIGVLERPDRPHSSSNRFVSRFSYIVVPSGKTLDLNAIHNQVKMVNPVQDGFSRNMGVGTWELNLASFLVDLNPNLWNFGATYQYNTNSLVSSTGPAFQDACDLLRFRYNYNWQNLRSVNQLFGGTGTTAFLNDMADGYGRGPLMTGLALPSNDPDGPPNNNVTLGWPGSDTTNHFFTTQDLFDPNKSSVDFVTRLLLAGTGTNSNDRYTYYSLLSQLGTDTGTEPPKMHLNYANVAGRYVIPDAQTNFVSWQPEQFFTNAADRLLQLTFSSPTDNVTMFGIPYITITNIPVVVSNQFVYSASLHHVFQLAANIYDASTPSNYPSVFRPSFRRQPNGDIYIATWVEDGAGSNYLSKPLDMTVAADRAQVGNVPNQNIYGVPWVIGAKKGFPNFNEFAMQSIADITRKLQVTRRTTVTPPTATNQMFVVGISNVFAFEAWNSYLTNYPNALDLTVANDMNIGFAFTNDAALDPRGGNGVISVTLGAFTNIAAGSWSGRGPSLVNAATNSFLVPLQTNFSYLADSIFRSAPGSTPNFSLSTNGPNLLDGYEQTGQFPIPQLNLMVTNRIRFILRDRAANRIVDYVCLNGLNGVRDLTSELSSGQIAGFDSLDASFWATNRPGGMQLYSPSQGVINQIQVALGNTPVSDWRSYGQGQAAGSSKEKAIDGFRVFMGLSPIYFPTTNTALVMQVPFTPTRRTSQYLSWQANDPLVHYTAGDLTDLSNGNGIKREDLSVPLTAIPNIGQLNGRFEPWGGYPGSTATTSPTVPPYSVEAKDPGIRSSDDWNFPTNKYPSVGWLGRVHRGTPWQTIYMKPLPVGNPTTWLQSWSKWTGNASLLDCFYTQPFNDRLVFDVFTAAFDANCTRGQLNVNQPNLASWSALLGGAVGLTNSATDAQVSNGTNRYDPVVILPAGADPAGLNSAMLRIWTGVTRTRALFPGGLFQHQGDVLATPELTVASPLLNTVSSAQQQSGISDAAYERLPQMLMGLMRGGDQPRFTIYAYGQALHPANRSIVTSGPFFGLCTNYQITAECATRTVVRIDGTALAPVVVIESFNVLPPE
jgi:hypothetical protein